jgi:hypothetical protein
MLQRAALNLPNWRLLPAPIPAGRMLLNGMVQIKVHGSDDMIITRLIEAGLKAMRSGSKAAGDDGKGFHCPPVRGDRRSHLSDVLILLKFEESLVPRPLTAVMIAIAMPAAIKPYSIAVAPDSSAKNFWIIFMSASYGQLLSAS